MTFDDGPSKPAGSTEAVLDELAQNDVKATFFISPNAQDVSPEAPQCQSLLRMIREGHSVQSHTWSHLNLLDMTIEEIEAELTLVESWVASCTGSSVSSIGWYQFRPPFGYLTSEQAQHISSIGYTLAAWNLDSYDWQGGTIDEVFSRTLAEWAITGSEGGSGIMLMHDASTQPGFITRVVEHFRGQGYSFVTTPECYEGCSQTVCEAPISVFPGVFR